MSKYEWAVIQLATYELTVCFRTRTISHPSLTNFWSWKKEKNAFIECVQRAVDDMREAGH